MATKLQPVKNTAIESFLREQGYTGIAQPTDILMDARAHIGYNVLQYNDGIVRVRQFDGFYRYTPKTSK